MKLGKLLFGGGPMPTESAVAATFSRRAFFLGLAQTGIGGAARRADGLYFDSRKPALFRPRRREQDQHPADSAPPRLDRRPPWPADGGQQLGLQDRPHPRPAGKSGPCDPGAGPGFWSFDAEMVAGIRRELGRAAGFQPVPVAEHLSFEEVRFGQCAPARAARRLRRFALSPAPIRKARRSDI